MDKRAWIAISLTVIGMVAWQWYYNRELAKALPASPPAAAPVVPGSTPAPVTPAVADPAKAAAAPKVAAPLEQVPETIEKTANTAAEWSFTNQGGGIAEITMLGARNLNATGGQLELNRLGGVPIGALSEKPGDLERARAPYAMRREGDAVIFERTTSDGLRIVKKFSPPASTAPDPYVTELEVTFTNTGAQSYRDDGLYLHTGGATPIHSTDQPTYTRFDWHRDGKTVMKDVNYFEPGSIPLIGIQTSPAKSTYSEPVDQISWASVNNQFYTTVLAADGPPPTNALPARGVWAVRFPIPAPEGEASPNARQHYGIMGGIGLAPLKLAPGEAQTLRFLIYTGPTAYDRLKALGHGEDDILNLGLFKIVSVFLLSSMNFLYKYVGNYALAIIALTCLIKAALWPLQSKAIREMKKMSLLAPKMTELKEKFKDDPQKMNQAVWQLQREYGVNPLGGCLPMLAQMPIFLGFYSMLGTAVELRQSSFLWVHDLSVPDTVGHIFGIPINPLPLIMAASSFWQMQITPKTGDQQQQKIFMFMPLIFVFICYNFASALALYWTVQNLLTVLQTYLTRHRPLPALIKKNTGEKPAKAQVVGANPKKKALR
jgi:YidC/Oxa1 family membrane protein insertase